MSRIACLILDPDAESCRRIEYFCRKTGAVDPRWTTGSVEDGYGILRTHRPEMALVGLNGSPGPSLDAVAAMAREFPGLYVVVLSEHADAAFILKAMRAGAHDFIGKPVREEDLRSAAEKAAKIRLPAQEAPRKGKVLSVFSNKGGNGTTTIAANLAAALARRPGRKVAVVDLVLGQGDVTLFFDVRPSYSILDLARTADKADAEFLQTLLVRHAGGVHVLADPPTVEEAEEITAAQVKQVLAALRPLFDYIVVDTPHLFDDRTLTALEASDTVLLVSLLNVPALRNAQRCLDLFGRVGIRDGRVRIVLSRYLPGGEIPREKVEEVLGMPVFFSVPNDYPTVIASVNRGRLLDEIAPDRPVARSFREMAALVDGDPTPDAGATGRRAGLKALWGLGKGTR